MGHEGFSGHAEAGPAPERSVAETPHSAEEGAEEALLQAVAEGAEARAAGEKLAGVRERLGMSRRGFLASAAGAFGGAMLGGKEAAADPKSARLEYTPEQERAYREGLAQMRVSAANDVQEISRDFIVYPDGSSAWKMVETEKAESFSSEAFKGATFTPPDGYLAEVDAIRATGARIETLHTHPTAVGDKNIPPSALDLIGSMYQVSKFSDEEAARQRFGAVSEAGVWNYRPRSVADARRLNEALESGKDSLASLDSYRREGKVFAASLRKGYEDVDEGARRTIDSIADAAASGTLGRDLSKDPRILYAAARLAETLEALDPELPEGARLYVRTLSLARKEIDSRLSRITGDEDTDISLPPFLLPDGDPAYVARWRKLGFDITFTPF